MWSLKQSPPFHFKDLATKVNHNSHWSPNWWLTVRHLTFLQELLWVRGKMHKCKLSDNSTVSQSINSESYIQGGGVKGVGCTQLCPFICIVMVEWDCMRNKCVSWIITYKVFITSVPQALHNVSAACMLKFLSFSFRFFLGRGMGYAFTLIFVWCRDYSVPFLYRPTLTINCSRMFLPQLLWK